MCTWVIAVHLPFLHVTKNNLPLAVQVNWRKGFEQLDLRF